MTTVNLVTTPSSVTVTDAQLSAQQYVDVDVVNVNQTFNLTSVIVDKINKKQIGNVNFNGITSWNAAASLYTAIQYQSTGQLIPSATSRVFIDTTAGTITLTDLAISQPGMYIIKLQLTSSNNVYSIAITSTGILVKNVSSE